MVKASAYEQTLVQLDAVLEGIDDRVALMATINCILKTNFDYFYWVGFYLKKGSDLIVGPYQGSLGCIHIAMGRGVCGAAAIERKTLLVPDVHQFPGHIACDPLTRSEIVVPVLDPAGELIGVFDVDSTVINCFNQTDSHYLEKIMARFFGH